MAIRAEVVLTAFVAAMLLSSALMMYGGNQGEPVLEVQLVDGTVTVDYRFPASVHGYPATVVSVPLEFHRQYDVAVLITEAASELDSAPANVQGLVDHMGAELENIGSPITVSAVSEASLATFLGQGNGTLMVAGALSPALSLTVWEWVRAGGVLVTIGPGPLSSWPSDLEGLAFAPFVPAAAEGPALMMGLRTTYPSYGVSIEDVLALSGHVLGAVSQDGLFTAMAAIPVGSGRVLAMGGPIESPFMASMEDVYAWDLARCLTLDIPWVSGPVSCQRVEVPSEGLIGTLVLDDTGSAMAIAAYNLNDWNSLFKVVLVR
ncbi:MAG: hypothetical protein GXY70_01740 [Euryarchaeota archaeon]|nr:hypothetical protein [Euryarchaeota archaeon]